MSIEAPSSHCYVGRLAPSPTGLLHIGHAATFLTAFERARARRGRLLLRIDDLDRQRCREDFVSAAKEDLAWLGITWEGELRQTTQFAKYRDALRRLAAQGLVYSCRCSRKDLVRVTDAPHEEGDEPVYDGHCRPTSRAAQHGDGDTQVNHEGGTAEGRSESDMDLLCNYRFRVPDGHRVMVMDDLCGTRTFVAGEDFGDFLVWRRDGVASYQLACVVDDATCKISEVVRGQDLLKSTARQMLLQRALELPTPAYVHTPLLRDASGQRLAKRHGALSLRTLRSAGMTPSEIRTRVQDELHHKCS